jgi:hypothetical protein
MIPLSPGDWKQITTIDSIVDCRIQELCSPASRSHPILVVRIGAAMEPQGYPLWKRCLVSCFIVLNFTTVAYVNQPEVTKTATKEWSRQHLTRYQDYSVRKSIWYLSYYGHLLGLDNRWQMFGRQSRFNWWFIVRGEYGQGDAAQLKLLPIPQQTTRSLLQRLVFDLKENKILLNLYSRPFGRECYSRYLARQTPEYAGVPIRAVQWELAHQKIRSPEEAIQLRKLRYDHVHVRTLNRFELPISAEQHSLARVMDHE